MNIREQVLFDELVRETAKKQMIKKWNRNEELNESQKNRIEQIENEAEKLHGCFDWIIGDKRMIALAKTNLEQAVMWAIKAII